ncbi:hypothetical protein [uncultured Shewanella sp.]|uniref:hypothetical protein n=1 Tax=Shewanella atlantica TaxID=271099 RepID=UPI00261AD1D1|nr:hypothetical protein [uncultured Shewanella sp.]
MFTITKGLMTALLAIALSSASAVVSAKMETVSGKINGHTCAHSGHTCPLSKLDPHLQLESAFVLQQQDGSYYFLSNVPRITAARYALELATVRGKVNEKLRVIMVDELMINGKVIWSPAMVDEAINEWESMHNADG